MFFISSFKLKAFANALIHWITTYILFKKQKKTNSHTESFSKTMSLSSEIDVRGETVDTAIAIIDKFLDDALLSSLSQVRIIHGKGTGQLRSGIHSYLRRLSYVKSYRLGTFGEGDSGVTVVEFK